MKKVLLGLAITILSLGLIASILLYPLLLPYVGLKTLPNIEENPSLVIDDDWKSIQDTLEKTLLASAEKLNAPAISAAIGLENKVVWAKALGYADIKAQKLANVRTQFRIGSVSKSVTSVGAAKMVENDQLDWDRSVQSYVPYFGANKPEISLRQLASHTGGIRHYQACFCFPAYESLSNRQFDTMEESIGIFGKDDLLFEPGDGFRYSTYGYTLLSAAMEEASDQPFLDYLQEEVFTPLKMNQTMGDLATQGVPERATFYIVRKGKYRKAFSVNNSYKWAGGGMLSTPTDLVKMTNALLNDSFLDPATKEELWKPILLSNGDMNPQQYALGWRIGEVEELVPEENVKIVHHGGTITGSITLLILFPEYKMSIAMMVNRSGSSGELFRSIFDLAKVILPVKLARQQDIMEKHAQQTSNIEQE